MSDKSRERVLVIGDDMRIFLAVVRSLGRAGKDVHAAPFNWHAPALTSKYISKVHRFPRISEDQRAWRSSLTEALSTYAYDLVIPCCDRAILPLHAHREDFKDHRIAIPNPAAMAVMFDKHATRRIAAELGIPVVSGAEVSKNDTAEDLISKFGIPLVLKARNSYSVDRLDTWGRVWIVKDAQELERLLESLPDLDRYLIETYFVGSGVGVSVLAHEGRLLHVFQHRRLREGWAGSSSYRISEPVHPDLHAACEKICRYTRLTGVCMFEFRYNLQTRNWVLLETNARFWGSMALPLSLGLDFPLYLFDLLVHGRMHPAVQYRTGIRARNIVLDARNLLADLRRTPAAGLLPWCADVLDFALQPIRWMTGRERSDSFVRDDLRPGFWEFGLLARDLYEKRTRPAALRTGPDRRAGKLPA